ncbi:MAG TPA: hypothetical protein VLH84_06035 [Patescibacteria group bacterium]|nr:hypothetical protein [Patescibacteria group bacterium]
MVYNRSQPAARKRPSHRPKKLVVVAVLVSLAGIVAILELTNTTHWFHHKSAKFTPSPTANANTKGAGAVSQPGDGSSSSSNSSSQTTTGTSKDQQSGVDPNTPLQAPTGVFVSSHHVDPGSSMQSVCNTTSGAKCSISFTKDGVTKSLAAQTTDAGGSTYWPWQPKDIGLTPGSWTITATATLGSQTKTASDASPLEVSQ